MYTFPKHKFPFWQGYRNSFKIKDFVLPSEWIDKHFRLSTAYAVQGRMKLFPWQVNPVNSIIHFDTVIFIAPVQTGKSLMGEAISAYMIDNNPMNMMFIYAKKDTVEDVFDERLKPMVKEIPAIRQYWDGFEDSLTRKKIKLLNCIVRVASAGLKTEIATWNAGFTYGSELAKWPKKAFSQTKAVEGRKQASRMMGRKAKTLYETSPENDQDMSYVESHKPGTVIFKPHYQCPHCDHWQILLDKSTKEKPNSKGEFDHNPERIKITSAAWYECENCKKEITEDDRIGMSFKVRWLDVKKKIPYEKIIEMKDKPHRAVFNWNRYVDTTWTFADCLSSYFDAFLSPNPNDLKTYINEDMADWTKTSSSRFEASFVKSKCLKYSQFGDYAYIPDDVSLLLIGIDTQDNGFYYVVRGYGKNMESWLIRADFIRCDMKEDRFANPAEVHQHFHEEIYRYPYRKKNGTSLNIYRGVIDRGGHRAIDVDYITTHEYYIDAYIGTTQKTADLIQYKNGKYMGKTEELSRIVMKQMEGSIWHLPKDIQPDYCDQILNQYDEEIIDTRGNKKRRWMTGDKHGKPDHFRDCENMLAGLAIACELEKKFFDEVQVKEVEINQIKVEEDTPQPKRNMIPNYKKEMETWGWTQ